MMLLKSIVVFCVCAGLSQGVIHDFYSGKVATRSLLKFYETHNLTDTCTTDVKPCDANEWRRVDGSCNNLKDPAFGTIFTPLERILPAHFDDGYKQRKTISGDDLPLARVVRLALLVQDVSSHFLFNHNIPGYAIYKFNDIGTVHDIENMILDTTYCCEKEHMNDRACTPNIIQDDDPVFRYSSIRCMNSTRPLTHQDYNCTRDKVPSVIKKATTPYDESQIYDAKGKGDKAIRSFENGMLKVEEEHGNVYPPNGPTAFCPNNVAPDETRCFENRVTVASIGDVCHVFHIRHLSIFFAGAISGIVYYLKLYSTNGTDGSVDFNSLLPVALYVIWFVRHHNYIASKLAEVNPCWDDEMLFNTARDINIAYSNQMYFYEWNGAVQGKENLLKQNILTPDNGFKDLYDDTKHPEVTLEYTYVIRWFHLMQEETAKLYDKHGNFIKDYPLFNVTFKMGMLPEYIELFTQSTFRAPCHGIDGTVTSDIANRGLPGVQEALDITAGDLNKGRNFGLAPYIDYIYHFFGINITSYEDLKQFIPEKYIDILKGLYPDVRDMDLMAGLWCSKMMEGGHIPDLLAAILNDNFFRAVRTDRHWFERSNRPHAFTLAQLMEVRKASLSLFLCNVGDGVTEIPENAFLKISDKNPLVPCGKIQAMDFSAWADDACNA